MTEKLLGQVSRKIQSAIKSGSIRTLNKALTATKNKVLKDLRSDTGLPNSEIQLRLLVIKAKKAKTLGSINLAVKFGLHLGLFKPKEKKVKVGKKTYYGVTVKVGSQPRQLVPGAFYHARLQGKVGKRTIKDLVLARKGSVNDKGEYVNPTAPRYKTTGLKTDILRESASKRQSEHVRFLTNEVNNNYSVEIDSSLLKLANK